MSGRAQGACCAIAGVDKQRSKHQRSVLILVCVLLFQPPLHQLDFELLIGDNFLSESPHLRILAVQELCFRHIDRCLMVRNHQSDKIDIAVARWCNGAHGHVHFIHARNQLRPIRVGARLAAMVVSARLTPCARSETARDNSH
jgi:hypothetical protein